MTAQDSALEVDLEQSHSRLLGAPLLPASFGRLCRSVSGLWASAHGRGVNEKFFAPPFVSRADFEATGYADAFPQLAQRPGLSAGDGDATELVPPSAVCQHIAAHLRGTTIDASKYLVEGYVFRNELQANEDAYRMRAFQQHDVVHIGRADYVIPGMEMSQSIASAFFETLEIPVTTASATDPFFGGTASDSHQVQVQGDLKHEFVFVTPSGQKVAIASTNQHLSHYGRRFSISTSRGEDAVSACIGIGLERVARSLIWAHGTQLSDWPNPVLEALGLQAKR